MVFKRNEGSVSILLIIVIGSFVWTFLIFADVLIYKHSENELLRCMALNADNQLADYESSLFYGYGLLYKNQSVDEEAMIIEAIKKDVRGHKTDDFIGKFIEIESLDINLDRRMIELNHLKAQIIEGMSFRVGVDFIDKIINLDKEMKTVGRSKAIIRKKNKLDDGMAKLGKALEEFQIVIHEIGNFDEEKRRALVKEIDEINHIISVGFAKDTKEIFDRYRAVRTRVDQLNRLHKHSIELFEVCIEEASLMTDRVTEFSAALESEKGHINSGVYEEISTQIDGFSELMGFMRVHDFANDYNYSHEKINVYLEKVNKLEGDEKRFWGWLVQGVVKPIYKNIELSNGILNQMNHYNKKKFEKALNGFNIPTIAMGLEGYCCNIQFDMQSKGQAKNSGLVAIYSEVKGRTEGDFEKEGGEVFNKIDPLYLLPSERMDFAKGVETSMTESILIGEYLIGTLNSRMDKGDDAVDYYQKTSRKSFFKRCEVEYIIFGKRDEAVNLGLVKGGIIAIRTGANLIHIYTDTEKMALANEVGVAVAGWTGLGVPLVSNAIILSWAIGESFIDLNELLEGEKVPLYKMTREEWRLDLERIKTLCSSIKSKPSKPTQSLSVKLDYNDYLRIFLLSTSDEVKLQRLLDVIEINTRLEPAHQWTQVETFYSRISMDLGFLVKEQFLNPFRDFIERESLGYEYGY